MVSERWSVFSRRTWLIPLAAACAAALRPDGPEPTIAIRNTSDIQRPHWKPHKLSRRTRLGQWLTAYGFTPPQTFGTVAFPGTRQCAPKRRMAGGEHKVHVGGSRAVRADSRLCPFAGAVGGPIGGRSPGRPGADGAGPGGDAVAAGIRGDRLR